MSRKPTQSGGPTSCSTRARLRRPRSAAHAWQRRRPFAHRQPSPHLVPAGRPRLQPLAESPRPGAPMPPCRLAAMGRPALLGCPRPVAQRMRPSPGPARPWGAATPPSSGRQPTTTPAASAQPAGAPPPAMSATWQRGVEQQTQQEQRLDRQEEQRRQGEWQPLDSPERAARYVLSHSGLRHMVLDPDDIPDDGDSIGASASRQWAPPPLIQISVRVGSAGAGLVLGCHG